MSKLIYTWGKVTAGDIISFRYKKPGGGANLNTVLVLNPRIPYKKKNGESTFHLVGLKLETRGVIPTIRSKPMLVSILEQIGEITVVSGKDNIFRVEIPNVTRRGVKKNIYTQIKRNVNRYSVYRTYDYEVAKKSQVFLEPIVLPKDVREALIEN